MTGDAWDRLEDWHEPYRHIIKAGWVVDFVRVSDEHDVMWDPAIRKFYVASDGSVDALVDRLKVAVATLVGLEATSEPKLAQEPSA